MTTLFISDLHLEDERPETTQLLLELLAGRARDADALYILGDLFEFWIGDDVLTETARTVAAALSDVSASGVDVYFIHGNRDFLLGANYALAAGMQLLPESVVIDLYGNPTLVLHGDTLCTDDAAYLAFRSQVRDPAWQSDFLQMSLEDRLAMARNARDASMQHTATAAMEIMDANSSAVVEAFERHEVSNMIHGHTHRPDVHVHQLSDGVEARRIVLADWYRRGSCLCVDAEGFEVVQLG
jgi:UDP-2,3-diacylglucosamine hydrolase